MDDLFSFVEKKSDPSSYPVTEKKVYSVTELNLYIKNELEKTFSHVWLEGEVSNLRVPQSGHCYLTLKDEGGQIKAIIFKSALRSLKFTPKEGQHLLCRGRITVYEPRGEYQIVLESVEPKGIGALQLAYEQLKEKLRLKGFFEQVHKKTIPSFPQKIGIITSPTGAAIRDMLQIIQRRHPAVDILINPVPVQGEEAAPAIARAIDEMNEIGGIDVLIIGRGGGSLEDLWAFNEESVAEAVFKSKIPVISAVGHETDVTISDFVADLRAPTPSAAAELVVKNHIELIEKIHLAQSRLFHACQRSLTAWYRDIEGMKKRLINPKRMIENRFQRFDDLTGRLSIAAARTVAGRKNVFEGILKRLDYQNPSQKLKKFREQILFLFERLVQQIRHETVFKKKGIETLISQLNTLGPLEILRRGYSITRKLPEQAILKSSQSVRQDDLIEILLAEGKIIARVTQLKP
ncbi:MAG: exodeoxyribonuclease VII large subunit [Nitrospiria bacterium]